MKCSICGSSGHNARTCPHSPRDHALWVKFDNMTSNEASRLQRQIMADKERIEPNARATAAKAKTKDLPDRIKKALGLPGGD